MGSLILCHRKRAKQPYEITRVHRKIYTIEELCYYICNNLYLIDYTMINQQMCDWIERELELSDLAERLREELRQNRSMEQFVLTILRESNIYSTADINRIANILEHLKNQRPVERTKYKADSLQKSGEYESAILVYQSIINEDWDESVERAFYGRVYACLGAAYGHQFLYKEAAKMYYEAYRICEEPDMLKAYLYCCYRGMPEDKYMKMLSGNPIFLSMASIIREDIKKIQQDIDIDIPEEQFAQWKKEYRGIDKR